MKQPSESSAKHSTSKEIKLVRRLSKRIKNMRDRCIIRLILETGCATGELSRITPNDFEFTNCYLNMGHGRKKRKLKIPLELSLWLNSLIKPGQEFLFNTRQSRQISPKRIEQVVKGGTKKMLGRELTPSYLRKLSIRKKFSETSSIKQTQKQSGIKNLSARKCLAARQIKEIQSRITNNQHRLIFTLLYETGCTIKELINLKTRDIDHHAHSVTIRAENAKNQKERISQITTELSSGLKEHVQKNRKSGRDFLFSSRQSPQLSDKRVFQIIKSYSEQTGIKGVSPQTLRNSHIAQSLLAGKPESEIRAQTGVKHLDLHHYGLFQTKKKRQVKQDKSENG